MKPKTEIAHIITPVAKYTLDFNTGVIKAKPIITRGDSVRSMTDEELAEWIDNDGENWSEWCHDDAPVDQETLHCLRNGGECRLCILDWLKEEEVSDG